MSRKREEKENESKLIKRGYWICQIVGWSTYVISGVLMTSIITDDFQVRRLFIHIFAACIFFLITHLSRIWLKKKNFFKKNIYKILGIMAGFVILASCTGVIIVMGVIALVDQSPSWPTLSSFYMSFINTAFTFTVWISLYTGFKIFLNYRENEVHKWKLEAKLLETEIAALKAQINPHFVFNALNNIRSLVTESPEKAREAITTLSKLLRVSLRFEKELVIPLKKEIGIVKEYLDLERLHLEERLQIFWNLSPLDKDYNVPALGIQTLVENAIKHGVSSTPGGGILWISTREEDGKLSVNVSNTGCFTRNGSGNEGIGLMNLNKRLKLFDERSRFKIEQRPNNTVNAEMILYPYESTNS